MWLKSVVLVCVYALVICTSGRGEGPGGYHSIVTGEVKVVISGDSIFVRPASTAFKETPRLSAEVMRWMSSRGANAIKLEVTGVLIDEGALSGLSKMRGLSEVVFSNTGPGSDPP